ncbi:MAG TPA: flagellar biosynthetic protein FliR [Polyangia bacterium]|nr:flagellar biosynthetic protein FliR [Polyangia bacterium]
MTPATAAATPMATAAALAAARMVPLALVATPLTGRAWPARLVVAALLVVGATPIVLMHPPVVTRWTLEPLVGLALGLVAALPFAAAEAAGALVDASVQPWRARAQTDRQPLADAYALLALALFAALGGPAATLRAALGSYVEWPLGAAPSQAELLSIGARLVTTAAELAAPALAALLLADLALALVARAQPALARAVDVAPLRMLAALLVLAGGVYATARALGPSLQTAAALSRPR